MPRLGLLNITWGFLLILASAMGGVFLSYDLTEGFLKDAKLLGNWQAVLQASAHGHTNLFGLLHIVMGLTFPYHLWSNFIKKLQTVGLGLGALAMGPGMLWRASLGPTSSLDFNGVVLGVAFFCAFLALASHFFGLLGKLLSRVS